MNCSIGFYSNGIMKGDPITEKVVDEVVEQFDLTKQTEMFFQKREGNLMYYAYAYVLYKEEKRSVGIVFLCYNGAMLKNPLDKQLKDTVSLIAKYYFTYEKVLSLFREYISKDELYEYIPDLDYTKVGDSGFVSYSYYWAREAEYIGTNFTFFVVSQTANLPSNSNIIKPILHNSVSQKQKQKESSDYDYVASIIVSLVASSILIIVVLTTISRKEDKYKQDSEYYSTESFTTETATETPVEFIEPKTTSPKTTTNQYKKQEKQDKSKKITTKTSIERTESEPQNKESTNKQNQKQQKQELSKTSDFDFYDFDFYIETADAYYEDYLFTNSRKSKENAIYFYRKALRIKEDEIARYRLSWLE